MYTVYSHWGLGVVNHICKSMHCIVHEDEEDTEEEEDKKEEETQEGSICKGCVSGHVNAGYPNAEEAY